MILIVGCSQLKDPFMMRGPARQIYTGKLTVLGIEYAEMKGWEPYILSGKYGIIRPNDIIDTYDLRAKAYTGAWPQEHGYWIGGREYFKNVPDHIKRLFPEGTSYCQMKGFLNKEVHPERYGRG